MQNLRDIFRELKNPWLAFALLCMIALIVFLYSIPVARAHDHDRTDPNWEQMGDEERNWLLSLKMPDNENVSCCGLGDQYWCDGIKSDGDGVFCQISDDRDDKQFNRPHVPPGTWIKIPNEKLKWQQGGKPIGNPTGHAIIFMSASRFVYCFVQATGI